MSGFFFALSQPVMLELAAEVTYPASESVSCATLYLNCQLFGIIYMLIYNQLVPDAANHPASEVKSGTLHVNLVFCGVLAFMAAC
eukprot:SAG22_NODE_15487_length_347_cov_1.834677_1_plen_84_part_10